MKTVFSKINALLFLMAMSAVCFTSCGLFEKYSDVEKEDAEQEGGEEVSVTSGDFVDLGLSVKWASCNVGAKNPWDFGDYYAWGEYEVKNVYDASNYKGPKDRQTICGSAWDVASWKLGLPHRMPTESEFNELIANCTYEPVVIKGVNDAPSIPILPISAADNAPAPAPNTFIPNALPSASFLPFLLELLNAFDIFLSIPC